MILNYEFAVYINNIGEEVKMIIKILGAGCEKCSKLEENTQRAVKELGIDASIEKVEDLRSIMAYGVMSTPAFVVDDKVKSVGRTLAVKEIKKYLK